MLGLLAESPFDTVISLFDAIDWSKVPIPAGAMIVISIAVRLLAKWYLRINVRDMQGQIDLLTGAKDLVEKNLQVALTRIAAQDSMIEAKNASIEEKNKSGENLQDKLSKLYASAKRIEKQVIDLRPFKMECAALNAKLVAERELVADLRGAIEGRDQAVAKLTDDLVARQKVIERSERRMRRILKLQGYLTQAKAMQAIPKFRPLEERRRPIISVLNLKGGVGKTTITAHLAGALARKGYRVLMVDLDLQGSLTSLMLPRDTINTQYKAKKLVQHFFRSAADEVLLKLSPYAVPVPTHDAGMPGAMHIAPCTDNLAYAELNLTLGWLLQHGKRDARFLLRKALHFKVDMKNYDIVLLDCPPFLNISCVNALAASDYLLVPTVLTAKATERVPKLLRSVAREDFVKHVNCDLKVMGVVANRANRLVPVGNEGYVWQNLPRSIATAHVAPVKQFESTIAHDAKISSNEEKFIHPLAGERAREMFDNLATELEGELPRDCRIAPPATATSG